MHPNKLLLMMIIVLCFSIISLSRNQENIQQIANDVLKRIPQEIPLDSIPKLAHHDAIKLLRAAEKEVLVTRHIQFSINQPATICLAVRYRVPFWLADAGFSVTDLRIKSNSDGEFKLWKKSYPPGEIRLGVNSIYGGGRRYLREHSKN